jgi:hypothetical protein
MNILDVILQSQGGAAVQQLGNQFELGPDQAQSALSALLPALAAGLQRNMSSQGGLDSLLGALAGGNHQRYLEAPGSLADAASTLDGNGILGHIFGSKEVSRQVAQRASAQTGIDASILKKMLPLVAGLVMGGLSSQRSPVPGGSPASGFGSAGGLLEMLTPVLDSNRDGSALDDILGMAGRMLGKK